MLVFFVFMIIAVVFKRMLKPEAIYPFIIIATVDHVIVLITSFISVLIIGDFTFLIANLLQHFLTVPFYYQFKDHGKNILMYVLKIFDKVEWFEKNKLDTV